VRTALRWVLWTTSIVLLAFVLLQAWYAAQIW